MLRESPQDRSMQGIIGLMISVKALLKAQQDNYAGLSGLSIQQMNAKPDSSRLPLATGIEPFYKVQGDSDRTLVFESRFESGNLALATKVDYRNYQLVLQNDINTRGHTQWFYFRVSNTTQALPVTFEILNHSKTDSLFNYGMRVLVYSEKEHQRSNKGWHRAGRDIAYFQNSFKKDSVGRSRYHYSLRFTYDFAHSDDTVYFAYTYPYTYSDLQSDLNAIFSDPKRACFVSRQPLCETLAGNLCEYLSITGPGTPEEKALRKGVFISARVHPGESNSSYMMKGALDFLTSEAPEADLIRRSFVVKVVPMINIDGVVNGNYRCSLAGCDLNRRWKRPSKQIHPVVYGIKRLCKKFTRERELVLYCDFHGHSRNKDIFMYGNNYRQNPEATRLFPYMMSKICPTFAFGKCSFVMQRAKEATSRMAMFRELNIPAVYTLEASFCGADQGPREGLHFSRADLMESGRAVFKALLLYCDLKPPKPLKLVKRKGGEQPVASGLDEPGISRQTCVRELLENAGLLQVGNAAGAYSACDSDSEPSEDNLAEEEIALFLPKNRLGQKDRSVEEEKRQGSGMQLNQKSRYLKKTFKGDSKPEEAAADQNLNVRADAKKFFLAGAGQKSFNANVSST